MSKDVNNQQNRLDPKKATLLGSIPAKILKDYSDILLPYLENTFNLYLAKNYFPSDFKNGDICLLFKKNDVLCKRTSD